MVIQRSLPKVSGKDGYADTMAAGRESGQIGAQGGNLVWGRRRAAHVAFRH
jgi:hypothetical protein